ncbi:MAG: C-type lectin domain-containing protein [Myxococcales bacterium]|nr:C-type lectin domain-containing protein [Myxococcales bacterium]
MAGALWRARGAVAPRAVVTTVVTAVTLAAGSLPAGCTRANPGFLEPGDGSSGTGDDGGGRVSDGGTTESGGWGTVGDAGGATTSDALTSDALTSGATTGDALTSASTGAGSTGDAPTSDALTSGDDGSTGAQEPDPCSDVPLAQHDCVEVEVLGAPYLFCQQALARSQAQEACAAYCGALPKIESAEENAALHALLLDPAFTPVDEFPAEPGPLLQGGFPVLSRWLGARYVLDELPFGWEWDDGAPLQAGLWGAGEPDITGTCAVMAVWGATADNGRWFTRFCSDAVPYRFVCEL